MYSVRGGYFCTSLRVRDLRRRRHPRMAPPRTANAATTLLWQIGVATALKLLLIPSYHSTDLEVHRNWLAVTRSLPLSDWYSPGSNPSPWTLDYPPFFAYFQRLLSSAASAVDPIITHLHLGIDYKSSSVIFFQRCSVILFDSLLFAGAYLISRRMPGPTRWMLWMLIVWSPMLIIVDHMHFQYNGFLLGWLLLSLWFLGEGRDLAGGILFAVLLCFKHLFTVAAPVYFVYLLRRCFVGKGGFVRGLGRLTMLGAAVVAVFASAFGPFVYYGKVRWTSLYTYCYFFPGINMFIV